MRDIDVEIVELFRKLTDDEKADVMAFLSTAKDSGVTRPEPDAEGIVYASNEKKKG